MREGWVEVRLSEVLEQIERPVQLSSISQVPYAGVRWYAEGVYAREEVQASEVKAKRLDQLRTGDITYNRMWATKAAFGVVREDTDGCLVTNDFPIFCTNGSLLPEFIQLVFQSSQFQASASLLATGTTERRRLKERDFLTIPISLPPLAEQRRIVDLIAAVDANIEAVNVVALRSQEAYAALLGQLSLDTEEHATVGELVVTARAGGTPNRKQLEYWGPGHRWLKSGEVATDLILDTEEQITEAGLKGSSAWLVPSGSVVVAMYGATAGEVGFTGVEMATNQAVLALRGRPDAVANRFLFHALRGANSELKERATGAAQPNLSKERVLEQKVPLPPVDEQRLLVELFDSLLALAAAADEDRRCLEHSRSALLADLLSGAHEIPDLYDELLEGVA